MIVKWVIVAVVFAGEVPIQRHVLFFDPDVVKTEADCNAKIAELKTLNQLADIWAKCLEVKRDAKPQRAPPGRSQD